MRLLKALVMCMAIMMMSQAAMADICTTVGNNIVCTNTLYTRYIVGKYISDDYDMVYVCAYVLGEWERVGWEAHTTQDFLEIEGCDLAEIISMVRTTSHTILCDEDDSSYVTAFPSDWFLEGISVHGRRENDRILGSYRAEHLYGDDNDDIIRGYAGGDRIYGGNGVDRLWGITGVNYIYGNSGVDYIYGGDMADYIWGGTGDDIIRGYNGVDYIHGDEGDDDIWGGNSGDFIYGDDGIDEIWGEAGDDDIEGGADRDFIHGDAGDDDIWGDGASDYIWGDAGDDHLWGGESRDWIYGGDDDDELHGEDDVGEFDNMWGNDGDDKLWDSGNAICDGGDNNPIPPGIGDGCQCGAESNCEYLLP